MSNRLLISMTDSGRDRLRSLFAISRNENRAVLLPYLTAGIPTVDSSVELFVAMADAGADGFEVGIPYADPLMDGPVIMKAGEQALDAGVTVEVALEVVKRVVDETGKPVLVMTYVNPVLRRSAGSFFGDVAAVGAVGVIIADLPVDEAEPFLVAARDVALGMALFVSPMTSAARLDSVIDCEPAFVYGIAEVGVTGERTEASSNVEALARKIRERSEVPIVFGVGISTPDQAHAAALHGDGVIVGSAVVRRVLDAPTPDAARASLSGFIADLASAMGR